MIAAEPTRLVAPRMGMPYLGHGVGLRRPHFDTLFDRADEVDFLEILVDNAMAFGGRPRAVVERAAREFPIVLHGVALSVGGPDPLDEQYLEAYARLARETGALWASDHLCYSAGFGVQYHDLIPLPFTEEAVAHVAARARQAQAALPVPFALENPSYYVSFPGSEMTEAEFVREVVERADCGLLLDVNNVWVNAENHGYDPRGFIDAMPAERVVQIHLAGHRDDGDVLIDTHGARPIGEVLELYAYTLGRTGPVSTLLEWDHDVPSLDTLLEENERIRHAARRALGEVAPWRG